MLLYVAVFMGLVSLTMPLMNADIKALWFSLSNFYFLQPMPILSVVFFITADIMLSGRASMR